MRSTRHVSLKWVLVPEAAQKALGQTVILESDKIKHLRKVLRMEWDEEIRVVDGHGRLFEARLEQVGDRGAVRLSALVRTEQPPLELELVVCVAKNATMDWIVEKAVECGATLITPVVSSRSVVRPDPNELDKYVRRWQTIMDEAVEQSERLYRPLVRQPHVWHDWTASLRAEPRRSFAFVSELRMAKTDEQALTECWQQLRAARQEPIRVMIGAEGGFSDEERDDLSRFDFSELSLGSSVLRVETAAVTTLTIVRASRLISE